MCVCLFLALWDGPASPSVFPVSVFKSNFSPRNSSYFYWRMALETNLQALSMLYVLSMTGISYFKPLSWHSKEMYVYVLTHVYSISMNESIYINTSICNYPVALLSKTWVILMSPTLIHHQMDHSGLSLLVYNIPLQQWKTWLLLSVNIYLIFQFQSWFSGLLTFTPTRCSFLSAVQSVYTVPIAVSRMASTHFQAFLDQSIFTHSL